MTSGTGESLNEIVRRTKLKITVSCSGCGEYKIEYSPVPDWPGLTAVTWGDDPALASQAYFAACDSLSDPADPVSAGTAVACSASNPLGVF